MSRTETSILAADTTASQLHGTRRPLSRSLFPDHKSTLQWVDFHKGFLKWGIITNLHGSHPSLPLRSNQSAFAGCSLCPSTPIALPASLLPPSPPDDPPSVASAYQQITQAATQTQFPSEPPAHPTVHYKESYTLFSC